MRSMDFGGSRLAKWTISMPFAFVPDFTGPPTTEHLYMVECYEPRIERKQ
jgi:hypothetical protein